MTGLGWTRCPTCDRPVVVTQSKTVGVHWMVPNRRCPASTTKVPEGHKIAKSLEEIKR